MFESHAPPRPGSATEVRLTTFEAGVARPRFDRVATEEPLEIRLRAGRATRSLAITMRTPGNDFELAAGFLYAEGIVANLAGLRGITYCLDGDVDPLQQYNVVSVDLVAGELPSFEGLERNFAITSACGICGRASLGALRARGLTSLPDDPESRVEAVTLAALPVALRSAQGVFATTGGLHAAALFDFQGSLVAVREDVGRHNALDKLIGWALLAERLPLARNIVLVSGRASFELVQKAIAAGAPILAAVSAPSSLAIAAAREFGLTLAGFVRGERFNVYAGGGRIAGVADRPA